MKIRLIILLLFSSLFASFGQILLKIGADNANRFNKYINLNVFTGLCFYGLSTVIWIYCLSFAKLNTVYAFTTLTFVLVYIFSFIFLKETLNIYGIFGIMLVLLGLYLIVIKGYGM